MNGRSAFAAGEAQTIAVRIGNDTQAAMRVKIFDRKGKALRELGEPGTLRQIRLSPDGRRLAVERRDMRPVGDIFTMDVATGISTRLTFHEAGVFDPVWSPDSRTVAYGSRRDDKHVIFTAAVGDIQGTPLVTSAESIKFPNDWSPDGRLILFHDATGGSIFAADTAAGQTARRLVGQGDAFDSVRISPDGRRVAFQVRDTSTEEVYVADFPSFARRTRVSAAGGVMPRWRRDGRELYYVSGTRVLMAVPVGDIAENTFGVPQPLFAAPIPLTSVGVGLDLYDPSADGSRFYLITDEGDSRTEIPPVTIIVNWLSALAKK
jgi:dipeptidyl aminopeptidase/acylaminoacyl peptidase